MLSPSPLAAISLLLATSLVNPTAAAPLNTVYNGVDVPTAAPVMQTLMQHTTDKTQGSMHVQQQDPHLTIMTRRGEGGNNDTDEVCPVTTQPTDSTDEGQDLAKRGKFFNPNCGGPIGSDAKSWWRGVLCPIFDC